MENNQMEEEIILTPDELDAIGEIMNISMGASATAVSTLLDRQVTITTPRIAQERFKDVDCSKLEPAVAVKISYIKGIQGTNIVMFRRRDMQLILDLLMGNEPQENEDFEFDEMSMSAACEVMNQMMGASATALSEILNFPINISTPTAQIVETGGILYETFSELSAEEQIVSISFQMSISGVMDSDFSFFVPAVLTRKIIDAVRETVLDSATATEQAEPCPAETEPAVTEAPAEAPAAMAEVLPAEPPARAAVPEQPQPAQPSRPEPPQTAPPQSQPMQAAEYGALEFQTQAPPPGPYGVQPPYGVPPGYPPQPGYYPYPPNYYGYPVGYPQVPPAAPLSPHIVKQPQVNVKQAQFPSFQVPGVSAQPLTGANAALLMGVPLEVSVVIGKARRKVKDILDFGPGTVVDLDKQTGAPAEIIVNGQLLAYGDVIVIGDNFGVRITEIVGTKDLLESLEPGT